MTEENRSTPRGVIQPSSAQSLQSFMQELNEELAAVERFEATIGRSTSHTKYHRARLLKKLDELKLLVN